MKIGRYHKTDIFRNCSCGTKRVYKKNEEGKVSRYFFDTINGLSQVLITYNQNDRPKKIYTYGNTTDQPISMEYRKGGRWHTVYYLYDGKGNVRQLVNSRGQVIANYNYLPFGEMMNRGMRGQGIEENEGMGITLGRLQNWGEENELRNTITYQGREYDRDAGLYYYRARYQDPRLGRFLEIDPLLREVPNYTTGNSWPTNGNSGCSCCGEANPNTSVNSTPFIPIPPENLMTTPQQMLPTLPINTAITNLYILENNNPVNLTDPQGQNVKSSCPYGQVVCNITQCCTSLYSFAVNNGVPSQWASACTKECIGWANLKGGAMISRYLNCLFSHVSEKLINELLKKLLEGLG